MNTHMDAKKIQNVPTISVTSRENSIGGASNLHELLRNVENHWSVTLRKDPKLKLLRDIFKRKMRGKINYHHMTTFLISSEHISNVTNTNVSEEVDEISKSLMSSRHLFELRKLKAKKNLITLQDCFMDEEETRKTILRIFDIFGLEKFIGEINCMNIINWVMKHLNLMYFTKQSSLETFPRIPNFVYKKASFASAFRAKNVMKQSSPSEKRTIQISIVNNLKAGLCWWTLIALRQIMIPIRDGNVIHNVWRYRYLIILKQEVNKFKKQYKVKQLDNHLNIPIIDSSSIGQLLFSIVGNKLRPIIRKSSQSSYQQKVHSKKINSLLSWCLEQNGDIRRTIKDSCEIVAAFLREKSEKSQVFAYTADISKCFSLVQHRKLLDILKKLLSEKRPIWITCGKGKDDKGFTKLIFCSANSRSAVLEKLTMNMQRKRVNSYETSYTHEHSTIWLLQELQSIIGSYYYQRGESIFRVTKGVPQGHPLSSNLAFAYLNSFENEYWRKEKIDSRIVYSRYEDDYIVLTTEKHIFHEMMRPLITGRNRYFLKINKEKLMASEKGEDITWCGVTINLRKIEFSHRRLCKDGIKRRLLIKF